MLDLSAAFDCVDHDILLSGLETSFGFTGLVPDWMQSYLVGRKQYVRYNGTATSTTVMKYGVPRGSALGPLYFILYTECFKLPESWGSSSTGMQMIFKFMITVLPVTHPSSPTGSLTASRSWAVGCRAIT